MEKMTIDADNFTDFNDYLYFASYAGVITDEQYDRYFKTGDDSDIPSGFEIEYKLTNIW